MILLKRTVKAREGNELAQGLMGSKWQSWDLNPGLLSTTLVCFPLSKLLHSHRHEELPTTQTSTKDPGREGPQEQIKIKTREDLATPGTSQAHVAMNSTFRSIITISLTFPEPSPLAPVLESGKLPVCQPPPAYRCSFYPPTVLGHEDGEMTRNRYWRMGFASSIPAFHSQQPLSAGMPT